MTDALDRLAEPGADLLERVDAALLAHGFPAGHPIADLLRRLGALPADALHAISALRPAPLRTVASELRQTLDGYERQRDLLPAPPGWTGSAGDRFATLQAALTGFLGETADAGRVTVAYLDDVADWMAQARSATARTLADVLGSTEAIQLRAPAPGGTDRVQAIATAAVTVGARFLATAVEVHDAGRAVAERWAGRLDEVSYRPPAADAPTGQPPLVDLGQVDRP
jgi:uncharacterized protein YukE